MNIIRLIGDNISMYCEAFGVPPPTITWFKGTDPVIFSSHFITSTNNTTEYITSSQLNISLISFNDSSDYYCVATNVLVSLQSTNSSRGTLTVHSEFIIVSTNLLSLSPLVPVIIADSPTDTVVNVTDVIQFTCIATGVPVPTIEWSTTPHISINDRSDINIESSDASGSVTSMLRFDSIRDTDDVRYTCTASNRPGESGSPIVSVSSSFNVTVQSKYYPLLLIDY